MDKKWQYYFFSIVLTAVSVIFVYGIANLVRFSELPLTPDEFLLFAGFVSVVYSISMKELYRFERKSVLDILYHTIEGCFIATFAIATIAYFDWTFQLPRTIILLLLVLNIILLPWIYVILRPRGDEEKDAIIIGASSKITGLLDTLRKDYNIIGFVEGKDRQRLKKFPQLGASGDLRKIVRKYRISVVIIALPAVNYEEIMDIILQCYDLKIKVKTLPTLFQYVLGENVSEGGLIDISLQPIGIVQGALKRLFDIGFALSGLLITLPVWLMIPLLIRLDSKGTVFYAQKRAALYNRTFTLYKFRTMVQAAERYTGAIISDNKEDPRITRVGRFLRSSHLDEIPQLFSILKGDMSVVGPRPERPELNKHFLQNIDGWSKRIFIKPGLTGLAQIHGASGLIPDEKIKWDLYYIKHQNIWFDIKIIIRQIWNTLYIKEYIIPSKGMQNPSQKRISNKTKLIKR